MVGSSTVVASRRERVTAFQSALQSLSQREDPFTLAKLVRYHVPSNVGGLAPPRKPTSHNNKDVMTPPPTGGPKETLQYDGTDWSTIVTAWLDAQEALDNVRTYLSTYLCYALLESKRSVQ